MDEGDSNREAVFRLKESNGAFGPEMEIAMVGDRFAPREMDLESLVKVLAAEHKSMWEGLARVKTAATGGDFEKVADELKGLDPIFRQHIADEESQILRLLIGELGVEGAKEEIRVFQQHRPIHRLMQAMGELASKSPSELADEQIRLNALFREHTELEEGRVFPRAVACHRAMVRRLTAKDDGV